MKELRREIKEALEAVEKLRNTTESNQEVIKKEISQHILNIISICNQKEILDEKLKETVGDFLAYVKPMFLIEYDLESIKEKLEGITFSNNDFIDRFMYGFNSLLIAIITFFKPIITLDKPFYLLALFVAIFNWSSTLFFSELNKNDKYISYSVQKYTNEDMDLDTNYCTDSVRFRYSFNFTNLSANKIDSIKISFLNSDNGFSICSFVSHNPNLEMQKGGSNQIVTLINEFNSGKEGSISCDIFTDYEVKSIDKTLELENFGKDNYGLISKSSPIAQYLESKIELFSSILKYTFYIIVSYIFFFLSVNSQLIAIVATWCNSSRCLISLKLIGNIIALTSLAMLIIFLYSIIKLYPF